MTKIVQPEYIGILGIILLCAGYTPPASASSNAVLAGMEFFNWKEFDSRGRRLLSENGLRYLLSVENQGTLQFLDNVSYQLRWRGYLGDVDYDGQTQPGSIFVSTTVSYTGWNIEATARYHFQSFQSRVQPAVTGAIGLDSWSRHLRDSTDALDGPVTGGTENYEILYSRIGLQLQRPGNFWHSILDIGIKYPFKTDEKQEDLNLSLEPDGHTSLYINYRLTSDNRQGGHHFIALVYDSYRFDASRVVKGFYQPESHQDTFSLMAGTNF